MNLIRVETTFACAGVIVKGDVKSLYNNVIIKTAPIFGWARGKRLTDLLEYYAGIGKLVSITLLVRGV